MIIAASIVVAVLTMTQAAPSRPLDVRGGHFFAHDQSGSQMRETTAIPLRRGTCYGWSIDVAPEPRTVAIREVFDLPAAGNWNIPSGTPETSAVSPDRARAVTEFQAPLNQGIIAHSWCVAEGDPPGRHLIRVYHGDRLLREFRFTLVAERF
jgi:hypothetical protein